MAFDQKLEAKADVQFFEDELAMIRDLLPNDHHTSGRGSIIDNSKSQPPNSSGVTKEEFNKMKAKMDHFNYIEEMTNKLFGDMKKLNINDLREGLNALKEEVDKKVNTSEFTAVHIIAQESKEKMLDAVMTFGRKSKVIWMATHEVHKRIPKIDCGVTVKPVVRAGEVAVMVGKGEAEAKSSTEGVIFHVKASV